VNFLEFNGVMLSVAVVGDVPIDSETSMVTSSILRIYRLNLLEVLIRVGSCACFHMGECVCMFVSVRICILCLKRRMKDSVWTILKNRQQERFCFHQIRQ
jgi:hypothetical protein